jgi:hypothetical protein
VKTPPPLKEDWRAYSRAARRLLENPGMRTRFEQIETSDEVAHELDLSIDMATELKVLLGRFGPDGRNQDGIEPTIAGLERRIQRSEDAVDSAQEFLTRSLQQLRIGARILMGMSLALFAIGLSFLVVAGVRSVTHPESAEVTAVIAGIGIVQIVALFYRNPLRDISQAIAGAQQAAIVLMTYTLAVGLMGRGLTGQATSQQQAELSRLTDEALDRLERFTEGAPVSGRDSRKNKPRSEGAPAPPRQSQGGAT